MVLKLGDSFMSQLQTHKNLLLNFNLIISFLNYDQTL